MRTIEEMEPLEERDVGADDVFMSNSDHDIASRDLTSPDLMKVVARLLTPVLQGGRPEGAMPACQG
jgi:hypothetical protein